MIIRLLGLANIYLFLTGLFNVANPPADMSTRPVSTKEYNKVIYLLLDALRIDSSIRTSKEGHIYNKMEYLYSIKTKFHALSVSGMPTETGARVLGLATGMPGNFLTSFLTLQGSAVKTDNIVKQFVRNGSVAFFGDSEWMDFFPELKSKHHHVMDTYGKYEARKKEDFIIERLLESVNNYDAIIAHLINLDSYGHIYGTDHEIMENQLLVYDKLIRDIHEKMSSDTLLVICSDHGVDNDGAHGGLSTLEMSSVGIFISKDDRFSNISPMDTELTEIRRRHICRFYPDNPSEIMGKEPYAFIHQDDILPTVCYFMGIPIPRASNGNFVHELVKDPEAYRIFAKQKSELLGIPFDGNSESFRHYAKLNYELSEKIFNKYAGKNNIKLIASGAISVVTAVLILVRLFRRRFNKAAHMALCFTFIMTAHSVFAIIHEDLFWSILFLASNVSLKNMLGILLLLQMIRPPSADNPLYKAAIAGIKLSPLFNGSLVYILELLMFAVLNNMKNFRWAFSFPLDSIFKVFNSHPQILLSLFKYFFHDRMNSVDWKLTLIVSSFSIDTLLALMFRPMESVYLIYVGRNLSTKNNLYTYFSLVNITVFASGLQKLLQSINYEVFFTFSDNFLTLPAVILAMYYLVYPRFRTISRFITGTDSTASSEPRKDKKIAEENILLDEDISMFQSFNLLLVIWSGYAICDSLSFYRFLANRTFFECFYYLCDFFLSLTSRIIKRVF